MEALHNICDNLYKLLGDQVHSARVAFVEFSLAESAVAALNCTGIVLGSQPIRVSPSKTPVRSRITRSPSVWQKKKNLLLTLYSHHI